MQNAHTRKTAYTFIAFYNCSTKKTEPTFFQNQTKPNPRFFSKLNQNRTGCLWSDVSSSSWLCSSSYTSRCMVQRLATCPTTDNLCRMSAAVGSVRLMSPRVWFLALRRVSETELSKSLDLKSGTVYRPHCGSQASQSSSSRDCLLILRRIQWLFVSNCAVYKFLYIRTIQRAIFLWIVDSESVSHL